MKAPLLIWGIPLLIYLLFVYWYTSFEGPLSNAEIESYLTTLSKQGATAQDLDRLRAFLETDTGDDFVMVNLIEFYDQPPSLKGIPANESAEALLSRYMNFMWPALLKRACHPVVFAQAASNSLDVWGIKQAGHWSQAAFMRYRSRRDLMEIAADPDFQGPHQFKIAAMSKTIAFPGDPWFQTGDPRLLLALVLIIMCLLLQRRFPARSKADSTQTASIEPIENTP